MNTIKFEVGKVYADERGEEMNGAVYGWKCVKRTDKFATFKDEARGYTIRFKIKINEQPTFASEMGWHKTVTLFAHYLAA